MLNFKITNINKKYNTYKSTSLSVTVRKETSENA